MVPFLDKPETRITSKNHTEPDLLGNLFKQIQEWLEMSKKEENTGFACIYCLKNILPLQNGTYRNHCPFCLASLHVDCKPGDRQSDCRGLMLPKKLSYKGNKGWQIIHKCQKCGQEKANIIAEGSVQADDWEALVALSQHC